MTVSLDEALKAAQGRGETPKPEADPPTEDALQTEEPKAEGKPELPKEQKGEPTGEPAAPEGQPRKPNGQWAEVNATLRAQRERIRELEADRDKSAAEKAELAALRKEAEEAKKLRAQFERQSRQQRPQPRFIDPVTHPQAFNQSVQAQIAEAHLTMRLEMSHERAVEKYGEEVVQAAMDAVSDMEAKMPGFGRQFATRDPVGAMVSWHKKQATLAKIGDDPDAYITSEVERRLAEMRNAPVADPKPKLDPSQLPTDLSRTPNVGTRTGSNWGGPPALGDAIKSAHARKGR